MRKRLRAVLAELTTPLWPAVLAGVLIGATVGALVFRGGPAIEAASLIRIYQPIDPDQIMTGAPPSPDAQQTYISGEVVFLNSPGFADAVAERLDETRPPRLTATQDAQSSIVRLSAIEPDFDAAQRIVGAALEVYSDHAQQQASERGEAALDALDGVISALKETPSVPQNQGAVPPADGNQTVPSLPAHIQQLEVQRLGIQVQINRPAAALQIVQPPTQVPIEGAPSWFLKAVGGGLVGGLLVLGVAYAGRRRAGVVVSPSALEGEIEHVFLPTVRLGELAMASEDYAGLARSLYAQLPVPRTGRIVVVGASRFSGSSEIAQLIAFAAAEHKKVSEGYQTGDALGDFESLADLVDEATVITDGGSVDSSPALLAAVESATQIIVVVMLGRDLQEHVSMATQLGRGINIPISVVCTYPAHKRGGPTQSKTAHSRHSADNIIVDSRPTVQGDDRDVSFSRQSAQPWPAMIDHDGIR